MAPENRLRSRLQTLSGSNPRIASVRCAKILHVRRSCCSEGNFHVIVARWITAALNTADLPLKSGGFNLPPHVRPLLQDSVLLRGKPSLDSPALWVVAPRQNPFSGLAQRCALASRRGCVVAGESGLSDGEALTDWRRAADGDRAADPAGRLYVPRESEDRISRVLPVLPVRVADRDAAG